MLEYTRHLRVHSKHTCETCGQSYISKPNFLKHKLACRVQEVSNKQARLPCGMCRYAALSLHQLNEHRRKIHGLVDRQSNRNLETQRAVENDDQTSEMHACTLCNKAFFLKKSLEKHLEDHPVVTVVPVFKPKTENHVTSEEDITVKEEGKECDDSENYDQSFQFKEIKDYLTSSEVRENDRQGVETYSNSTLDDGKNEDTDSLVSCLEPAALAAFREENIPAENSSIEKDTMDRRGDKEREQNAAITSVLDNRESATAEATNMPENDNILPGILEITPAKETDLFRCSLCPEAFALESDLSKHFQLEHQITEPSPGFKIEDGASIQSRSKSKFTCKTCGAVFVRQQSLNLHKKSHPENCYKCNLCQKSFVTKCSLMFHKRWHSQVKQFRCHKCSRKFLSKHHLETHMKLKHSSTRDSKNKLTCDVCLREFTTHIGLFTHYRFSHITNDVDINQNLECSDSGEKLLDRGALINHMRTHPECKPYSCRHCQAMFRHSRNRRVHEEKHATKSRKCKTCDETFLTWKDLQDHRRQQHLYKCHICNKLCRSQDDLDAHSRSHLDTKPEVKPYLCDVCSAR